MPIFICEVVERRTIQATYTVEAEDIESARDMIESDMLDGSEEIDEHDEEIEREVDDLWQEEDEDAEAEETAKSEKGEDEEAEADSDDEEESEAEKEPVAA